MKMAVQIQLLPDSQQAARLRETVERFNDAANWLAGIAFEHRCINKFVLRKLAYRELRERFGLSADTASVCIFHVAATYKTNKDIQPHFRSHAAVPFTFSKNLSFKGPALVSIRSIGGRIVVPCVAGEHQHRRLGFRKCQSDLILRSDGKWFLIVNVDAPVGTTAPATDFIGVDLGVENIAADSDGEIYSSKPIEAKRAKYAKRRRSLGRACKDADRNKRRRCHKAIKQTKNKEARYPSSNEIGSTAGPSPNSGASSSTRRNSRALRSNSSTQHTRARTVARAVIGRNPTARARLNFNARHAAMRPMPM